jgi:ABC-type multidrug transport system fused ATPase/permease subunit
MLVLDGRFRSPELSTTLTRLTNDLLSVKNWLSYGSADLAVACLSVTVTIAYLSLSHPWLALSAALSVAIILVVSGILVFPLRYSVLAARKQRGKLSKSIGEKLSHRETIRYLRRSERETIRVRELSLELTRLLVRRGAWSGLLRYTSLAALPLTLIFHGALTGSFIPASAGADVAWLLLISASLTQLQDVGRAIDYRTNFGPAIDRVRRVMALPVLREIVASGDDGDLNIDMATLHVEGLVASKDQRPASRTICPGDRILLSCPSNRARHQIIRVLVGLDSPRAGRLVLDGVALDQPGAFARYKRMVGLASDRLDFLPGTVRGNLRKSGLRDLVSQANLDLWSACGLPTDLQQRDALLDLAIRDGRAVSSSEIDARLRLVMAVASRPRVLLIEDPALGGPGATIWDDLLRLPELTDCAILLSVSNGCSDSGSGWIAWNIDAQSELLQLAS